MDGQIEPEAIDKATPRDNGAGSTRTAAILNFFAQRPVLSASLTGAAVGASIAVATPPLAGLVLGVGAAGPVAGGLFAWLQGPAIAAGGLLAHTQSTIMLGASASTIIPAAGIGAVSSSLFSSRICGSSGLEETSNEAAMPPVSRL